MMETNGVAKYPPPVNSRQVPDVKVQVRVLRGSKSRCEMSTTCYEQVNFGLGTANVWLGGVEVL